jgi:hypothetical protein
MSKDQKEICLFCKWWKMNDLYAALEPDDDGIIYPLPENRGGECRFSAPSVRLDGKLAVGAWPQTFGRDWCSKFTERRDDHDPNADIRPFRHISEIKPNFQSE